MVCAFVLISDWVDCVGFVGLLLQCFSRADFVVCWLVCLLFWVCSWFRFGWLDVCWVWVALWMFLVG